MASLNRCTLIGRIGAEPITRYTASGSAICSFSVATSEAWKDKATGEKKESTEWHKVVLFGKVAEFASQYASKGREVFIEGKQKTRKWKDKDQRDQYTTEIIVSEYDGFKLFGAKPSGNAPANDSQPSHKPDNQGGGGGNGEPDSFPFDEGGEIPFVKADFDGVFTPVKRRLRHQR